jgi:hypothetical protein
MATATFKYKLQKPDFEERKAVGSRTLKNYPSQVPVIVAKANRSGLRELENFKLLLPASSKVSDIVQYINEKLKRPIHAPLYIYVDSDVIAASDSTLARLYQEYRDDDYFLYLSYFEELIYNTSEKES